MNMPAPLAGPASDGSYPRPDFVLFGVANPAGGVILFASADLVQASVDRKDRDLFPIFPGFAAPLTPEIRTTLFVELRKFTMIYADDYGEALRRLMDSWQPPPPKRRALPQ